MHTFQKPLHITRPVLAVEAKPDVDSHADIDWSQVSVAEAIDADRMRNQAMREELARVAHLRRRRSAWDTFLQVMGVRRTRA